MEEHFNIKTKDKRMTICRSNIPIAIADFGNKSIQLQCIFDDASSEWDNTMDMFDYLSKKLVDYETVGC